MKKYQAILIEDQNLVRHSLTALLDGSQHLEICHSTSTVSHALELIERSTNLDLIICDYNLKGETALDLLTALHGYPAPPVIVLTSIFNASALQPCMSKGAKGFIFKEAELSEFYNAIDAVGAGSVFFSTPDYSPNEPDIPSITEAEKRTLKWLATGMSNKQIAQVIGKSNETVKSQVTSLLRKLECKTRTELATKAIQLNLFDFVP